MKRFKELYEVILTEIQTKRIAGHQYGYYYDGRKNREHIYILDNDKELMAFGDIVEMNDGTYVVGNVLGYGFGDLVYGAASAHFGKLVPSGNESDLCKRGWKKRFDGSESSKWNKEKTADGIYDESEDYMNYIYELKDKSSFKVKNLDTLPNVGDIIK